MRHITKPQFERIRIPLPPLCEQKRITAILSEQGAAVQKAQAAAELQLEAAMSLPASVLRNAFQEIDAGPYDTARLGDLLRLRKDVIHPRDEPMGQTTFVGLEHIERNTGIRTGSLSIDMAELTGRKPRFRAGDIVYGYLRPYLNKVWVAEFDGLCSVDQYVYSVRENLAHTEFVALFLRSPVYLERAPITFAPGQLPRIRTEEVASVTLKLPPLHDQMKIADHLRTQMASVGGMVAALHHRAAELGRLTPALLRLAFSGGL